MKNRKLFTSESVTEGHPDKICDQISDAILDAILKEDPEGRVACETTVTTGMVLVTGEITTKTYVDIPKVVRDTIRGIGYTRAKFGFDSNTCSVLVAIDEQSPEISASVDVSLENKGSEEVKLGAGDQGLMFGYACNETEELMPLPIMLSHKLAKRLSDVRKNGDLSWLRPDGKTQVTVEYDEFKNPVRVDTVVISTQHDPDIDSGILESSIFNHVILPVIDKNLLDDETKYFINPSGSFVVGGPQGDAGLTGRKIIVDTYGGYARHGGGAFCVDGDTEYITPDGWKKMSDYEEGTLVGQWNNGNLEFVIPDEYITSLAEKMYKFKSPYNVDMVLSENHDIVYLTSKNNLNKKKVKDVILQHENSITGFKGLIPVYFDYDKQITNVLLTDSEIKLQIAFCADGSIPKSGSPRLRIKKQSKIDRLIDLLTECDISYTVTDDGDYKIFRFNPPVNSKSINGIFKGCNSDQMRIIFEEVMKWDGDSSKSVFRTTDKLDADFIQFIFMSVTGKSSSIIVDDRLGEMYGNENKYERKSVCYEVYANNNKHVSLKRKNNTESTLTIEEFSSFDGNMYCFSVPSGMLLLRRENKVFVTGNSGKDATKVDRSGAYAARYVAKNIVGAGFADKCEVQLSYAIGVAKPISISIDTFGTGKVSEDILIDLVNDTFDLTPSGIIDMLDLRKPIYQKTASYGHFGRADFEFTWEKLDKVKFMEDLFEEKYKKF